VPCSYKLFFYVCIFLELLVDGAVDYCCSSPYYYYLAVSNKFNTCKRRHDLQFFDECLWVEFPTYNGPNLLIGNHYFSPDVKPDIICEYFRV
jgi:hypothetical protein